MNEADTRWLVYTRHFAEALRFELSLDLEDQLVIAPPLAVTVDDVLALLRSCAGKLAQELKWDRERRLRCYVGGPANGRHHGHAACGYGRPVLLKLARAKWAAYWMPGRLGDGRAFYAGEATSQAKARHLARRAGGYSSLPKGEAEESQ